VRVLALVLGAAQSSKPADQKPADCDKAAEHLANFEIGTAATPEVRAPVVTRHRGACVEARLTAAEATCIATSETTWSAIECAPRMFPQRATGDECAAVSGRMREAILADMPDDIGSAGVAMVDKMLPVIETSCREDNWPATYRRCVIGSKPGDMASFKTCDGMLPQPLQFRMGERLKPIVAPGNEAPPRPATADPAAKGG
jgi:hypothetical protein